MSDVIGDVIGDGIGDVIGNPSAFTFLFRFLIGIYFRIKASSMSSMVADRVILIMQRVLLERDKVDFSIVMWFLEIL